MIILVQLIWELKYKCNRCRAESSLVNSGSINMFRAVVFLSLTLIATAYGASRIVGGSTAAIEYFNYQVALLERGTFKCGGVLVKPNIALTVAHCLFKNRFEPKPDPAIFVIRAGSSFHHEGGILNPVKTIHVHPKFENDCRNDYDIAVLELETSYILSDSIGVISLAPKGHDIPGNYGTVTGWGSLYEGGPPSNSLRVVRLTNYDLKACEKIYHVTSLLSDRMSCWSYPSGGGRSACKGDEGSPLVTRDDSGALQLTALSSWSYGCGSPYYPGVYAALNAQEMHDFITQYL